MSSTCSSINISCTLDCLCHWVQTIIVLSYLMSCCSLSALDTPLVSKTSKLHVTGLCVGNSPVTSEFPAQRASNAENVSIWWRHHESSQAGSCLALCGGRVTRFPFVPLNVFVYISYWAAWVSSQNRPHFECDYWNWWLTRALLDAIQLAACRRNMIKFLCKIGTSYY